MAMAVRAVVMTLFATAPAFRRGARGAAATIPRPRHAGPLVTITRRVGYRVRPVPGLPGPLP